MEEIDKEKFGAFIMQLRKEQNLTQKELAERLYVTDKAVSKWERGVSFPDISLLLPIADLLHVSVSELLYGNRFEDEKMVHPKELEELVQKTIHISKQEQEKRSIARKQWKKYYIIALPLAVVATVVLWIAGRIPVTLWATILVVEGLGLGFGAYMCFAIKDVLPRYFDENRVTTYGDGVFRMNLAGIAINNRNWPHIILACRRWLVVMPVLFPVACLILGSFLPLSACVPLSLVAALGFFIPVIIVARKYE